MFLLHLFLLLSLIQAADVCIPTSPAAMPPAPCQTCPMLVEERFDPSVVDSSDANGCAVRTYTCTVSPPPRNAVITGSNNNGPRITLVDRAMPTDTIALTCNPANTAWVFTDPTAGKLDVTHLRCDYYSACKQCTSGQIVKLLQPGNGVKPFTDDKIDLTGACAERTFKCDGKEAVIELFGTGMVPTGTVYGAALGQTAVFTATCNADGTGWEAGGKTIVAIECADKL